MEPSGFDYVARQVPLYRDLLLSLPQWVKEQAFDFHFSAGQPISLCGREGICFLVGEGLRFPLPAGCPSGHFPTNPGAVFTNLRLFRVCPRGGAPPGLCALGGGLPGGGLRLGCYGGRRGARFAGRHFSGVPHPPPKMGLCGQALYRRYPCGEGGPGGWPTLQWKDHLPAGYSPFPLLGAVCLRPPRRHCR